MHISQDFEKDSPERPIPISSCPRNIECDTHTDTHTLKAPYHPNEQEKDNPLRRPKAHQLQRRSSIACIGPRRSSLVNFSFEKELLPALKSNDTIAEVDEEDSDCLAGHSLVQTSSLIKHSDTTDQADQAKPTRTTASDR